MLPFDLAYPVKYTPGMSDYPDLDSLHGALSACRLCAEAGYTIESQPIFSGRSSARLMLIGQAPGEMEAPAGQPFSGDAGRRLFRWFGRAGWDEREFRAACYITSVTKCFPGRRPNGEGDRVPTAAERKLCHPWLEGELEFVQPEVIVPVGRLAVQLFYPPKTRLADVVGASIQDEAGRHIVPLPHPSGASRWLNDARNVGRVEQAIYRLRALKMELGL